MEDRKHARATQSRGTKRLETRDKPEGAGSNGWRKASGVECDKRVLRERKEKCGNWS